MVVFKVEFAAKVAESEINNTDGKVIKLGLIRKYPSYISFLNHVASSSKLQFKLLNGGFLWVYMFSILKKLLCVLVIIALF